MESEKVKEIKESLQQEIHITEYVDRAYAENVSLDLLKDILTLINELESENKSLQDLCNKTYEDLTKEIDRLEKENVKQLKQFAERLKGKLQDFGDGGEKGAYITEKDIYETLKEFIKD